MALLESQLIVKKSAIANAGKGLFTKGKIEKGSRIVEYKGTIRTWKEVSTRKYNNRYLLYVTSKRVIDAQRTPNALARYANDAMGSSKRTAIRNNAIFVNDKGRVFIEATRRIAAGEEIYVQYGKEYWDILKDNE